MIKFEVGNLVKLLDRTSIHPPHLRNCYGIILLICDHKFLGSNIVHVLVDDYIFKTYLGSADYFFDKI